MKENDNAPNQCGVPSPISVNCPGQHTTTMCNSVINTTFPKRIDIALQLIMSIQENILGKYKSNSDVTQREDTWLQYLKRFVVIRVRLSNIQFLKCFSSLTAQILMTSYCAYSKFMNTAKETSQWNDGLFWKKPHKKRVIFFHHISFWIFIWKRKLQNKDYLRDIKVTMKYYH